MKDHRPRPIPRRKQAGLVSARAEDVSGACRDGSMVEWRSRLATNEVFQVRVLVEPITVRQATPHFGRLAEALVAVRKEAIPMLGRELMPWPQRGGDIDGKAIDQVRQPARLLVAVAAALKSSAP